MKNIHMGFKRFGELVQTLILKKLYIFKAEQQREKERNGESSRICVFIPRVPPTSRAEPSSSEGPKLNLGLPCGLQGPVYLSHLPLLPRKQWQEERFLDSNPLPQVRMWVSPALAQPAVCSARAQKCIFEQKYCTNLYKNCICLGAILNH